MILLFFGGTDTLYKISDLSDIKNAGKASSKLESKERMTDNVLLKTCDLKSNSTANLGLRKNIAELIAMS